MTVFPNKATKLPPANFAIFPVPNLVLSPLITFCRNETEPVMWIGLSLMHFSWFCFVSPAVIDDNSSVCNPLDFFFGACHFDLDLDLDLNVEDDTASPDGDVTSALL